MIDEFLTKQNVPDYRIDQFNQCFYKEAISSFEQLTTWPKDLREKLIHQVVFSTLDIVKVLKAKRSNTTKILFKRTIDGKLIEAVSLRYDDGRNSVCASCMVGCPVGCVFCASGKLKFGGNLSAREIIDQILAFQRIFKKEGKKVTNIVFMGMGEPLLNLQEVQKANEVLTDENKFGMSKRRITISTSGYISPLRKLIDDGFKGRIAISLHAPNQKLRELIMPTVAKTNSIVRLFELLDDYVKTSNKRITYEYILINKLNDSPKHAKELVNLLKYRLSHLNLIPFNPIQSSKLKRSTQNRIKKFVTILKDAHINYTIRKTMGDDVGAACGQLAGRT